MVKEIWNLIFYYLIDLVKLGLILWGILEFPFKKNKLIILIASFLTFLLIIIAILNVGNNRSLVEAAVTIILLVTVCILFQGKSIRKLFSALLVYLCVAFCDVCVAGIMSLLFNMSIGDIINHDILNFIGNSFSVIVPVIIILIKKRRKRSFGKIKFSKKVYILFFTGAVTGVFIVGGLMLINLKEAGDRTRGVILIVMIIACFAYFATCLMLVFISESRDSYKVLSQINQTVIESQQRYYMLAHEKEQEIKSIRHEMKNHITCINGLYNSNKLQEMHDYINQLIDQTESVDELFDTGNDIVNAILNDAESRYQKEGIRILLEGAFPKELTIAPMDLCVIIANAISNAVEAIQKLEHNVKNETLINMKISSFKEDLFIDIWNPISHKVEILEGKLQTTKQDKSIHGFGTKNMIQRVEKYHGTIDFESKEDIFYVHIYMKNQIKSERVNENIAERLDFM